MWSATVLNAPTLLSFFWIIFVVYLSLCLFFYSVNLATTPIRYDRDSLVSIGLQYANLSLFVAPDPTWPKEILRENKGYDPKRCSRGKCASIRNRLRAHPHNLPCQASCKSMFSPSRTSLMISGPQLSSREKLGTQRPLLHRDMAGPGSTMQSFSRFTAWTEQYRLTFMSIF